MKEINILPAGKTLLSMFMVGRFILLMGDIPKEKFIVPVECVLVTVKLLIKASIGICLATMPLPQTGAPMTLLSWILWTTT
jgi:hypothetical protein